MENLNDPKELDDLCAEILQNLSALKGAPSLQIQDSPPDFPQHIIDQAEAENPDVKPLPLDPKTGALKAEHPAEFVPDEGNEPGAMDTTD